MTIAWRTPPASSNVRQEQMLSSAEPNATADDEASRPAHKVTGVRLLVDRVAIEDEGAFTCEASNAFGSASLSFTLQPFGERKCCTLCELRSLLVEQTRAMSPFAEAIAIGLNSSDTVELQEDAPLAVMCALRAGYPRPHSDAIKWARVPETMRLAFSQRAGEAGTLLSTSAVKPEDAGVYRCFVDAGVLSVDQLLQPNASELTLRVSVAPKSRPPGIHLTPAESLHVLEGALVLQPIGDSPLDAGRHPLTCRQSGERPVCARAAVRRRRAALRALPLRLLARTQQPERRRRERLRRRISAAERRARRAAARARAEHLERVVRRLRRGDLPREQRRRLRAQVAQSQRPLCGRCATTHNTSYCARVLCTSTDKAFVRLRVQVGRECT